MNLFCQEDLLKKINVNVKIMLPLDPKMWHDLYFFQLPWSVTSDHPRNGSFKHGQS